MSIRPTSRRFPLTSSFRNTTYRLTKIDKYILIYKTTKAIIQHPITFGKSIQDTKDETKQAARYLGEGVIFFYAIYQIVFSNNLTDLPISDILFVGEMLAAAMIASAIVSGLITHPIANYFSDRSNAIYGSLSCFLYWTAFCFFVIVPVFAVFILGAQWFFSFANVGDDIQLLTMMVIMVPIIFVYYIATITSWIGYVYDIEPVMGGIAIAISYSFFTAIGTGVAAVASYAMEQIPL